MDEKTEGRLLTLSLSSFFVLMSLGVLVAPEHPVWILTAIIPYLLVLIVIQYGEPYD